jgi:hypothetical protein
MTRRRSGLGLAALAALIVLAIWLWHALADERAAPPPGIHEAPPIMRPAPASDGAASAWRSSSRPAAMTPKADPAELSGRVTSRVTAEPIAKCRVAFMGSALGAAIRETRSEGDGRFVLSLGDEFPGEAESFLVAAHAEFRAFVGLVRDVPRALDGTLDLRLDPRLEVVGSAKLPDGTPVAGARVRLVRQNWDDTVAARHPYPEVVQREPARGEYLTHTDQAGGFRIPGLAPGRYAMHLTARGLLRHTGRNEVADSPTHLSVPPSKTDLHIVLEPFEYVACRPVDARTGEPIRTACAGNRPGHVQDAVADHDALRDVVGAERLAAMAAEGVFIGLVDVSGRGPPLNLGFGAPGYRDRVFTATAEPLPDRATWPAELRITDVPLEPEPRRRPAPVSVELTGPAWVDYFRSLDLLFFEKPSTLNPTPGHMLRQVRVSLRDRRGTIEALPGMYMILPGPGFSRFKPVPQFEVRPEGENVLQLSPASEGVLVRVRGLSPAEVKMPLFHAELREAGEPATGSQLVTGAPDPGDPYEILLVAPLNKALRLEVRAGPGPCGHGVAMMGPFSTGLASVYDVEVPLDWLLP